MSTVVTTTTAALGPSRAATSVPPTRWPDVPPATGKFTICAANRNAADRPSNGTLARRQFAPHLPQGEPDARGGNHRRDRRRLAVNKSIWNVHD